MTKFISPNEALAQAQDQMLDGRDPETETDWILIFNSWALNLGSDTDLELNITILKLMNTIYSCSLTEQLITDIAIFQFSQRS